MQGVPWDTAAVNDGMMCRLNVDDDRDFQRGGLGMSLRDQDLQLECIVW